MKKKRIKAWAILCDNQAKSGSPFLMAHWDEDAAKLLSLKPMFTENSACKHKIVECEIIY